MIIIGQHVILRDRKKNHIVVKVCQNGNDDTIIRFGKLKIPATVLIGSDYFSVYRANKNGKWNQVDEQELQNERLQELGNTEEEEEEFESSTLTNQNLNDSNTAQILSSEDIEQMKAKGIESSELISQLILKSTTFNDKTKFSQNKYIRKKQQKHLQEFTILPINISNLSDVYQIRDFKRIGGLRFDYISTMLGITHVGPGSRVLILDNSSGLLTAAILQRMAGIGCIYRISGDVLSDKIVHEMNFPETYFKILKTIPLSMLESLIELNPNLDNFDEENHPINENIWIKPPKDLMSAPDFMQCSENPQKKRRKEAAPPVVTNMKDEGGLDTQLKYLKRQRIRAEELKALVGSGVDACFITFGTERPKLGKNKCIKDLRSLMMSACHHYLKSDGKVVVYSLNYSLVLSCHLNLMKQKNYVGIRCEELFLREYQVIPFRTHPLMNPTSRLFSGFLLSGIKTVEEETEKQNT